MHILIHSPPNHLAHLRISLEDIFVKENVSGTLGFGNIYDGQLSLSGELINITALRLINNDWDDEKEQQFWMEISLLSSLKHKNLVSIVGFCNEVGAETIIYKHESRGRLDSHLSDPMLLTWVKRLEISIGVAHALSYIHYDEPRDFSVIHRNISSETVRLNNDWEPKLSLFHHSMKIESSETHHSFHIDSVWYRKGYTDPTCLETNIVNHKSDIYSFGIVLFELLCGRKSVSDDQDNKYLAPVAIFHYREKLLDGIIDPDLWKQMNPRSLNIFAETAYECLNEEQSQRPNMDEIVTRLEKALELQLECEIAEHSSIVAKVGGTSFSHEQGSASPFTSTGNESNSSKKTTSSLEYLSHSQLSFEDIESITNNFAPENIITEKKVAWVYQGRMLHSGQFIYIVARGIYIKYRKDENKKFMIEKSMLSSLNHTNLVSVIGFCDECMITVYKKEANGSLNKYLSDQTLTWMQRLKICLGVAKALSYIHYDVGRDFSVIHCNIKSSIILLDDKWESKLSGFKLSLKNTVARRHRLLLTRDIVKNAYMDPKYITTGGVTHKSDVYSLGVVLFEVLCGRSAVLPDEELEEGLLSRLAKSHLDDMIDPHLRKQMDPEAFKIFSETAYYSIQEERAKRPHIDQVVNRLEKALEHQWKRENPVDRTSFNRLKMVSKNLMQMSTNIVKLDRFDGGSFKRWQKKMQFILATLKVAYVLTNPYLVESKNETQVASRERVKFENDDFICRGHILNAMSDPFFDVYQNYSTAKETLECSRGTLLHGRRNNMFTQNNMNMDESIQVASIIDKLPSTWKDVKKNLKHRQKKSKKNKKDVICYNCKKPRHFKRECHALKKKQDGGNDNKNKDNNFVAMTSEAFSLEEEKSWWVDSGATRHVCNNQTMFKTYEPSDSMLYMGNHSTTQMKGKGKINLVFTFGNTLTLNNVLHVPDVRKNLVSGSLLNKFGFKLVFESNKFILSKGGRFIGKGYHTGEMFKLNITDVVNSRVNDVNMIEISDANDASAGIVTNNNAINNMPTSSYYFDSSLLWHARLGHVYFKRMRNMANANLIPKLDSKMINVKHTDRCCEYYDPRYFQSTGIVHQVTAPYTPQQNGITERKNCTLMDMVNSMMSHSGLSSGYWDEALLTTCYILNRVPSKRSIKTLYEDACFDKNRFRTIPKAHEISKETLSTEIPITTKGNNDDSFPNHQQVEPRRSTRQRRQRTFGRDFEMYLVEGDRKGLIKEYLIIYNLDEDPQTYYEAMKSHDSSFWKETVNDEMDSIIGNNTWTLVDLPPGSKSIKSKWIFKRKLRVDGSIEKFKAQLVAKGFTQREGLDYFDTYAPVARTTIIRILIALASINELIIHQIDVKTAFLNDLGEADVILGIKILRKENRLMLLQSHYIEMILKRFGSFNCLPVSTPFEVGSKLTYNTSRILAQNKYDKVIGSLIEDPSVLEGYTDASWITDQKDYASMSGWIFTLGGGCSVLGIKETDLFNRLYYDSRVCGTGFMLLRNRMATRLVNKHTLMAENHAANICAL
nr:protein kinase-like domain, phloem protein 2-like protein [Tanacetum cinerariifolium]